MKDKKEIFREPLTAQSADRDNKTDAETIKEPPYRGLETKYIPRSGG